MTKKWKKVLLKEVAIIERNIVKANAIKNNILYVGLENIQPGGEFINVKKVQNGNLSSSKFSFKSNHLLYGKLRPYLAKIARPNFEGICSTDILPVLTSSNLNRDFLFHFLLQPSMIAKANSQTTGANLPRLSPKALSELEIPLPPLEEQKRIAATLDKADAIRRKRQQAIQLADEFLRSVFLDMFGDPVTNPKGWEVRPIKDFGKVTTGNTPSRKKTEFYGNDIEWIKSDNINTPEHFLTKAEEKLSLQGKKNGRIVPANSILVTCIAGSPDCIGNTALADREVAFNQQINAITPFSNIEPYFLYVQILTAKKLIQSASTNSMKGMISKGIFQEIKLLYPPLQLQNKFGLLFIRYLKSIEKEKFYYQESDNLFHSLTQRAFRGEL